MTNGSHRSNAPLAADEPITPSSPLLDASASELFIRNVSMKYVVMAIEVCIGLIMLPFNISHLGQSAYGTWMLAASVPAYFSILDLGYGVAQVKFVAKYRATRDWEGLNQIASTLIVLFTAIGLVVLAFAAAIALNLNSLFNLNSEQATIGRDVLLIISVHAAIGFPFSVFGGIVNGFQRFHLNGIVAIATSIAVAIANVAILLLGFGLVALVAVTTLIRISAYIGYRANAYRVFPALSIGLNHFRKARLREVTGFSVFILLIDVANKINYSTDIPIVGAFLGATSVAVWTVSQRVSTAAQDLTTQVSGALFPLVVDFATLQETTRLREVFLQGTRLSLAMIIPIGSALILLASPLIMAWVGPRFGDSVPILWILVGAVIIRVGNSTATTVLKGAGEHTFLTIANIIMGISNVVLSILLINKIGIIGVALGTIIPLGIVSVFVLFPKACRRVEISVFSAVLKGVLPAVWPAIPIAIVLVISSSYVVQSIGVIVLQTILAVLLYGILFITLAISPGERNWYLEKLKRAADATRSRWHREITTAK